MRHFLKILQTNLRIFLFLAIKIIFLGFVTKCEVQREEAEAALKADEEFFDNLKQGSAIGWTKCPSQARLEATRYPPDLKIGNLSEIIWNPGTPNPSKYEILGNVI